VYARPPLVRERAVAKYGATLDYNTIAVLMIITLRISFGLSNLQEDSAHGDKIPGFLKFT
jgi:hypothetical protein